MRLSIDAVRETGKVAGSKDCAIQVIFWIHVVINTIYNHYINMAKELEKAGANIIAIKDMAGLLKPEVRLPLSKQFEILCWSANPSPYS